MVYREKIEVMSNDKAVTFHNVTEQVKTIRTIPLTIKYKGTVVVQGEGIMKISELERYNKTADEKLKNAEEKVNKIVTENGNLEDFQVE